MTTYIMTTYIIREMSKSDDPADQGTELKRFRGQGGWNEAKAYRDELYAKDGIQSYISKHQAEVATCENCNGPVDPVLIEDQHPATPIFCSNCFLVAINS